MESNNKGLIIGLVIIILLAVVFLLLGGSETPTTQETTQEIDGQNPPSESFGEINQVDLESAQTPEERLPEGFPSDLPVNTENLVDSFTVDYTDGSKEASVIFQSDSSIGDLRSQYITYFEANEYTVQQDDLTEQDALLAAERNGDGISVAITQTEAGREVFVSVFTQ